MVRTRAGGIWVPVHVYQLQRVKAACVYSWRHGLGCLRRSKWFVVLNYFPWSTIVCGLCGVACEDRGSRCRTSFGLFAPRLAHVRRPTVYDFPTTSPVSLQDAFRKAIEFVGLVQQPHPGQTVIFDLKSWSNDHPLVGRRNVGGQWPRGGRVQQLFFGGGGS